MKLLRFVPLLLCLLGLPQWGHAQISTDTCCAPRVRSVLPERPTAHGYFRFSGSLGIAAQYRPDASDNQAFLSAGALGTFAADYYFRQRLGLGIEAGYLSYNLRPAYAQYFAQVQALDYFPPDPTEQLPLNNNYSFHVLAGPVLSLRLLRHLTLTTTLRGGVFYNDAPTGGVYNLATRQLLYRFAIDDKRLQAGGAASLALYYPLSPAVQLGLGASAVASPVTYSIDNLRGTTYRFDRVLGGYSAFASLAFTVRPEPARAQLPVVLPSCYAPVLAPDKPAAYNAAQGETPLLKWKSGAPIYATDEEFTVQVYALPTNKLVFERTTLELQVSVPLLKLPDATTQLYYTVQASRRDQAGQRCLSPITTGNVLVVSR